MRHGRQNSLSKASAVTAAATMGADAARAAAAETVAAAAAVTAARREQISFAATVVLQTAAHLHRTQHLRLREVMCWYKA